MTRPFETSSTTLRRIPPHREAQAAANTTSLANVCLAVVLGAFGVLVLGLFWFQRRAVAPLGRAMR